MLGDVAGHDVLELGCGAAQWSVALAPLGARVRRPRRVALAAPARAARVGGDCRCSLADAERLPFADGSFDIVFCDHGAHELLRPRTYAPRSQPGSCGRGGLLAFCGATPFSYLTWDPVKQKQTRRLHRTYDDLGRQDFGDGTVDWVLGPGEWVRLLRGNGFEIEDLIELRPPAGAKTTYREFAPRASPRTGRSSGSGRRAAPEGPRSAALAPRPSFNGGAR